MAQEANPVDLAFAILCFVCFLFGTPANAVSLYFFYWNNKDVPSCIYIVIAGVDVLSGVLVLPVG